MGDEIRELAEFLTHEKAEVRLQAVEIVSGLAASNDGVLQLVKVTDLIIPGLLRLLGGNDQEASAAAATLVNLSAVPQHSEAMIEGGLIGRIMELLRSKDCTQKKLLSMVLSNVTTVDKGAQRLCQENEGTKEGLWLAHVLSLFLSEQNDSDELAHLGNALYNVCRTTVGRKLLLAPGTGYVRALLPQLKAELPDRRLAAAETIRNCCLDKEVSLSLLLNEAGPDFFPSLLQPISGKDPFEPDSRVRQAVAEAVEMIAGHSEGCGQLWAAGAPELLRSGYADEQVPGVCEAMERTAEAFNARPDSELTQESR
ncbi:hypothetical protein CYMTET_14410 [Cymbomonas tetramitiformis]|uniref:Protein HGH1 N-terminal domain-containing protein n=1 Tax=Cymbomonas tetramitiformis TaxID=36881 RepID=A0AAE0L9Y3_9CHLO|nr:hypothetical protein CYMTET_14410 [Cymbomonas tetramitiformis]